MKSCGGGVLSAIFLWASPSYACDSQAEAHIIPTVHGRAQLVRTAW